MEFSKFNYLFKSQRFGNLLYNSETNTFAELDDELYTSLLYIKESNDISGLSSDLLEKLKEAKILVPKNDTSLFYRKRLRYYFQNYNATELGFALAPTTFCNFNCPYCYEENRKPVFMTEELENQFILFIKKHESVKNINLTWYGGEPLTGFKTIQSILSKMDKENIHLKYHSMVTNGYLLDEDKSKFFECHPLNDIQITIDGSREYHDQRRILSNGGKTYDTIIRNIDTFFKYNKKTYVLIRVNIDSTNKESFFQLYSELTKRWKNELLYISPAFVRGNDENANGCSSQCGILNRAEHVKFYFDLKEKYGMDIVFFPRHTIGCCGATTLNYYVVGPSGELYKCWNDIGIQDRVIGYLFNDIIPNYNVLCQYISGPTMFDDEQCKNCSVFPICAGGCQWMRIKNVNEGTHYDLCTYKKDYLEQFLEAHYEMRKNAGK
ncbi:radical SAM/SPASM domain-containing protein [uncultured Alistipes sp.]|uniref:radical SAM/SPASM domain-containing protein n=1 Tax=uncultured Alistipes sp. TaxID=538949 RepID=UPI00272D699B|nr:radical SAM protein [uncultured Alistipes sp.]